MFAQHIVDRQVLTYLDIILCLNTVTKLDIYNQRIGYKRKFRVKTSDSLFLKSRSQIEQFDQRFLQKRESNLSYF